MEKVPFPSPSYRQAPCCSEHVSAPPRSPQLRSSRAPSEPRSGSLSSPLSNRWFVSYNMTVRDTPHSAGERSAGQRGLLRNTVSDQLASVTCSPVRNPPRALGSELPPQAEEACPGVPSALQNSDSPWPLLSELKDVKIIAWEPY